MLKTVGNPSTRSGDQTIVDGNLVIGTAGKGVDFSADSNNPGATSEVLDDSEEGTFLPTVVGTTTAGTVTYVTREGYYTKIGNVVYYSIYLSWTGGTGAGNLVIGNLPFVSRIQTNFMMGNVQAGGGLTVTAGKFAAAQANPNTTNMRIVEIGTGTGTFGVCAYDAEAALGITGFYFTA
jgi:hypothetical protein